MKLRFAASLAALLCFTLWPQNQALAGGKKTSDRPITVEPRFSVLSPLGTPPPIKQLAMAPRLNSLDGKTIYIVDVGYPETKPFFDQMASLLSAAYPKTKWVVRNKISTYFEDDPDLWKEIKTKGHGMIIALGH